jgi:hypothetical protein
MEPLTQQQQILIDLLQDQLNSFRLTRRHIFSYLLQPLSGDDEPSINQLIESNEQSGNGIGFVGAIGKDRHKVLSQQQPNGPEENAPLARGGPPDREESPADTHNAMGEKSKGA